MVILIFVSYSANSQNVSIGLAAYFRAQNYLLIARQYDSLDQNIVLNAVENGVFISKCNNFTTFLPSLYYTKAKIFDTYYQYDSSFIYYQLAEPLFEQIKDSVNAAKCLINIGVTYHYYNDYDTAFVFYQKAVKFLQNSQEYILQAKTLNNIALIEKKRGFYNVSIKYYQQSLDLYDKIEDEFGKASVYQNIGVIYWEQKNYQQALESFNFTEKIYQNTGDFNDLAGVYANLGLIYNDMNDTAKALYYYDEAIELYSQSDNKKGIATILVNKAVLVDAAGFYDDSKLLFEQALIIFEDIKYNTGIFVCKVNLSRIYAINGNAQLAISTVLQALSNQSNQINYLKDAYLILAKNYTSLNDYKSAYYYLDKYVKINDTIFSLEKNKQINELRTKYETDKKEAKIIILQKDAQIVQLEMDKKDKRIRTITIFLILIVLFSVVSIYLYFQKQKSYLALVEQNVKLAKSDIEKEKRTKISSVSKTIKKQTETNLNESQKKELIDNIIVLMEEEKYFLNSQFTINDFAKKIHSNRNYLSQIINEHFHTNFNNFVNEYRIKEARKMLLSSDYQNYTIEGIANEVGFHSKATFNTAFKKFTGVTPSFFKKNTQV